MKSISQRLLDPGPKLLALTSNPPVACQQTPRASLRHSRVTPSALKALSLCDRPASDTVSYAELWCAGWLTRLVFGNEPLLVEKPRRRSINASRGIRSALLGLVDLQALHSAELAGVLP